MTTDNGSEGDVLQQQMQPSAPAAFIDSYDHPQPSQVEQNQNDEIIMVQLPDGRMVAAKVMGQVQTQNDPKTIDNPWVSDATVELQAGVAIPGSNTAIPSAPQKPNPLLPSEDAQEEQEGVTLTNTSKKNTNSDEGAKKTTKEPPSPSPASSPKVYRYRSILNLRDEFFRVPSGKPNNCNLMYGIMHFIVGLYLMVIMIFTATHVHAQRDSHYDEEMDKTNFYLPPGTFWVYLACLCVGFIREVCTITMIPKMTGGENDPMPCCFDKYQILDPETNIIHKVEYETYFVDSRVSTVFQWCGYFDPPNSSNWVYFIRHNVLFPSVIALCMDLFLLYIPNLVIVGWYFVANLLLFFTDNNAANIDMTTLFVTMIGFILLVIGFCMHLHRWRSSNIIRKQFMQQHQEHLGWDITLKAKSYKVYQCCDEDGFCDGCCKPFKISERMDIENFNDNGNCFNGIYRWFHLLVLLLFWVTGIYGVINYDFAGYETGRHADDPPGYNGSPDAMIAFLFFLSANTLRYVIDLVVMIGRVHNRFNYIKHEQIDKVALMPYMDYLCDHPVSVIVGYLYKDVGDGLYEALKYNYTFPYQILCWFNIWLYYAPLFGASLAQAVLVDHDGSDIIYEILWIIVTSGCFLGIMLNITRLTQRLM